MLLNNDRARNRLKHRGWLLLVALTGLLDALVLPAVSAQAACSVVGQPCVRDDFDARAYDLNTGTDDWATNWAEIGEGDGPTLGVMLVPVTLGELRFQAVSGTDETNFALSRDVAIPAAASSARRSSARVTSATTPRARAPSSEDSALTAAASRAQNTTSAPSSTSSSTTALPIPLVPPVTSARLWSSRHALDAMSRGAYYEAANESSRLRACDFISRDGCEEEAEGAGRTRAPQ